jgi:ATP-dependent helicase/nuclease subunit B
MAIQFILGRSGTGKTTLCKKQIVENLLNDAANSPPPQVRGLNNLVFLVPEQATYQAERAILSDSRIKGYSRLHVLSFQRLCYMIFGKNLAARPLTSQAREMIVHRLLVENAGKLSVFSSAAQRQGTAGSIAQTISELQKYGKNPDDVDTLINQLDGKSELTAGKLKDINLVYKQYLAFIEGNFLNSDNQLNLAKDSVAESEFLKGCCLWVDGFAGFTTSESLMLAELLKTASSAKIAMCLDPQALENDYTGIFEPTAKTYSDLLALIKSLKLQIENPVILTKANRFENSKALTQLEKNVFGFEEVNPISCDGDIKITACAKTRLEVDFVARQICRLVREKKYRWRDIAVIASEIDEYRHFIQAIFSDFKIPFFIDRRRDLQQYPAVELITSALKIAIDRFSTGDVINYLKSDLTTADRAEVDRLENYCLAYGIEAKDWLNNEKWIFAQKNDGFDNESIEKIRLRASEQLLQFRTYLQSNEKLNAEDFCTAIFNFLESLEIRSKLTKWTKDAFEAGMLDDAQLHQQFFSQFTQLMDDFVFIFKNSSLTARQYASIIGSMLGQITVALIPPALDQVLVGSIERSRHPDLKAVFLIGATQQQFPIPVSYDNILNDKDRKVASDSGFELSRSGSAQLLERRYLSYIAFTRPSDFLCISYPLADEKGNDVQPSFLLNHVKRLYSDLQEEKYFGTDSFTSLYSISDLTSLLAARLGRDNLSVDEVLDAKCKWLLDNANDYKLDHIKAAIKYDNTAKIEDLPAEDVLITSATKLQSFASCPYGYFAKHILGLKERKIFELEPFSLGLFFHKVLEILFNHLKSIDHNISDGDTDMLERFIDDAVTKLLTEDSFLKSFHQRAKHNTFIILSATEMLKEAVLEFSKIAIAGNFRQIGSEIGFGGKHPLPAIEINLPDGKKVCIEGKIDRVDVANVNGSKYCLIIDYKTSETKIDWSMFKHGLELQLPIYLLAAKNSIPVGAFYFQIQVFARSADLNDIDGKGIIRKPKGIFNGQFYKLIDNQTEKGSSGFYGFQITKDNHPFGDYERKSILRPEHFANLMSFAKAKIAELGGRIIAGEIDIKPYRYKKNAACGNCDYKAVCRFDWQINEYADVEKVSKTGFLQNL